MSGSWLPEIFNLRFLFVLLSSDLLLFGAQELLTGLVSLKLVDNKIFHTEG